uniref:Orf64 n=1 Tax=Phytophthora sojae TaxID=67593 RepID=A4ZHA2_PHYSO|nr:orf64 [Phytophthora sojae]ABG54070.1 orf64 [Phytophthora sojae]
MNKNKKFFTYKNKIILTNGSSLKITSIKYLKNYQLNSKIFKETKIINDTKFNLNKNKLNFIKKII